MNTKLTLSIDESVVARGKRLAAESGKSLSQMVSDYIIVLDSTTEPLPVSEKLLSLVGVALGDGKPTTIEDYHAHLVERYR